MIIIESSLFFVKKNLKVLVKGILSGKYLKYKTTFLHMKKIEKQCE